VCAISNINGLDFNKYIVLLFSGTQNEVEERHCVLAIIPAS